MCSLSYGTVDIQGRVRGWMLSVGISPSQYHLHVCRRRVVVIEFAPRLALPRHRCSSADYWTWCRSPGCSGRRPAADAQFQWLIQRGGRPRQTRDTKIFRTFSKLLKTLLFCV